MNNVARISILFLLRPDGWGLYVPGVKVHCQETKKNFLFDIYFDSIGFLKHFLEKGYTQK